MEPFYEVDYVGDGFKFSAKESGEAFFVIGHDFFEGSGEMMFFDDIAKHMFDGLTGVFFAFFFEKFIAYLVEGLFFGLEVEVFGVSEHTVHVEEYGFDHGMKLGCK